MKHLYVLRHAKSDWSNDSLSDKERPLNARGKKDAVLLSRFINKCSPIPELIYCSIARRTRETVKDLVDFKMEFTDDLYSFYGFDYIEFVKKISESYQTILIVGHNPSIEELLDYATGLNERSTKIPTASLFRLELNITSWSEFNESSGLLHWLITPKLIHSLLKSL